jgi:hypothetical protein
MFEPIPERLPRGTVNESQILANDMVSAARRVVTAFLDASSDQRGGDRSEDVRDPRLLIPRLLLRMYRLPPTSVSALPWVDELSAVISDLSGDTRVGWRTGCLDEVHLQQVDSAVAREIHERHHYIGSFHDGIHLALIAKRGDGEPISLVTLSEVDVAALNALIPPRAQGTALVLSRMYSSYAAPKNTLSRTLAKTTAWLRHHHQRVKLLVTYCDPNLGFTGASYRAANWSLLGSERKRPYIYVDGEYTTLREIRQRYGTYEWGEVADLLGARVERSQVQLMPLQIYARYIRANEARIA